MWNIIHMLIQNLHIRNQFIKYYFIIFNLSIFILSCSSPSNHVTSQNINNSQDRINELSKYFNLRTEVLDTEFDIFDVNLNDRNSIPGATSRDYKIALLIEEENLEAWLTDVDITSFPLNYTWTFELTKNNKNFETSSEPLMFTSKNKELLLFEAEGIILLRIVQN